MSNSSTNTLSAEGIEIMRKLGGSYWHQYVERQAAAQEFLGRLRNEIPEEDRQEFFLTRIALPALRGLVSENLPEDAEDLLASLETLHVTARGVQLGETPSGKAALTELGAALLTYSSDSPLSHAPSNSK